MMNMIDDGHEIVISNEYYQAIIVPHQGGKVKSLISLKTGREFLYQDTRQNHSGNGYDAADHSGWDECFPNIRSCEYPLPSPDRIDLPDHGFIWNAECEVTIHDQQLRLTCEFPEFNVRLIREYQFESDNVLTVHYQLMNDGSYPFVYLTAAHILFLWEQGMKVIMPEDVKSLYVYRSSDPQRIEPGTWLPDQFWDNDDSHYNCKLFTPRLSNGSIILEYENESIEVLFDVQKLPYAGVWVSKHWGDMCDNDIHCFSLQPTNLASATLPPQEWLGVCETVEPNSSKAWSVSLRVHS